jgi:hypothetical protein
MGGPPSVSGGSCVLLIAAIVVGGLALPTAGHTGGIARGDAPAVGVLPRAGPWDSLAGSGGGAASSDLGTVSASLPSGCFTRAALEPAWHPVPCAAPRIVPFTVRGDYDWAAVHSVGGPIGSASGRVEAVQDLTSEAQNGTASGTYSLQLNARPFTCDTPYTDGKPVADGCWVQFVFAASPGEAQLLVQFWLLQYRAHYGSCPSASIPGGTEWLPAGASCFANGAATLLQVNGRYFAESVSNLTNLTLSGAVVSTNGSARDEVELTDATTGYTHGSYLIVLSSDPLDLARLWRASEFNVLGDGGGAEAEFNSGAALLIEQTLEGPGSAPVHAGCGTGGFSGESNNLELGACSAVPPDHIVYTEENPPASYVKVNFTERGLLPGTAWGVNVTGEGGGTTQGRTLTLWLPPGSYPFTPRSAAGTALPGSGEVNVTAAGGKASIVFVPRKFAVTLTETGLPVGTRWCVAFPGRGPYCSTDASREVLLPNGSYRYTARAPQEAYAAPGGSFAVAGGAVTVSVTFTAADPCRKRNSPRPTGGPPGVRSVRARGRSGPSSLGPPMRPVRSRTG